ncbi:MAG TPA: hypothetical protein VG826_13245 [Pirellulales bacterium]|nr:hypothetical protein [Pirellulales bacterium]
MAVEPFAHDIDGNLARFVWRKLVRPRGNAGKGDRRQLMTFRQRQRFAITGSEQIFFAESTTFPDCVWMTNLAGNE